VKMTALESEDVRFRWTELRVERLVRLVAEGRSDAEIAAAFGDPCTPRIVRHRARRMKLARPVPTRREAVLSPVRLPVVTAEVAKIPEPRSPHNCTITGLTNETCRYPLWDFPLSASERFYCGAPADLAGGRPYCDEHMERCLVRLRQ